MAALRILYHHRIAATDGMRVHIAELVEALRAQGCEVLIVGPEGSGALEAGSKPILLERLSDFVRKRLPNFVGELLELAYNIPDFLRLSKSVRNFKPDIIYERYNLYLLSGLILRRLRGLPLLLEINSPLAEERSRFGALGLRRIAQACENSLWRGADHVFPVTEVLAQKVRQARGGADDVSVIHNGANLNLLAREPDSNRIRAGLGIAPTAVVLGFVGFVRGWHGVGWAVESLADLGDNAYLLIVGDGPALPELKARAEALGVGARVRFCGAAPHHLVADYVESFDIALQIASVSYASPLKLFEYMALGRAIVAPDQPNIREILADGESALLFAPEDKAAFAQALTTLAADGSLRERLGREARQTILDHPFTWESNARRVAEIAQKKVSV